MAERKIRILELARAGKWGLDGSEITKQDIAELAETFAGKRPITIGHGDVVSDKAPKFGDVLDAWATGDGSALAGPVIFTEAGNTLYEGGYYDGWSISKPRRASDGKCVLHHLAILGAVPPKIPGLEELAVVNYGDPAMGKDCINFSGNIPEREDEVTEREQAHKALKEAEARSAELEAQNKTLTEQAAAAKKSAAPADAAPSAPAAPAAGENAQFADMQKELAALRADRRKERIDAFKREVSQKLPAGIAAKAAALAEQIEGVASFDFSDNGKTERRDALGLLRELLNTWPEPVKTGALGYDYADQQGTGEKPVDWGAAAKKM